MPGDSLRGSARPALSVELDEGGEPAVKRGSAPRHQARLQHFEDLLAGGAQPEGAFHVGHESRLLRAAEGEERDGHELAHLGGDVATVAQALFVDPVVRLHEVGILPGRELPLRIDVTARFLHPGDQRVRALRPLRVRALRLRHVRTSSADVYHTRPEVAMILIEHAVVVTMDAARRIFLDGSVLIDGECIAQVGRAGDVRTADPVTRVIDGRGRLVLPGFIDTHAHLSEHLSRGLMPDEVPVDRYVPDWYVPLYSAITPEEEAAAAQLACLEMLRTGTTTFCEAGTLFDIPAVAQAVDAIGLRSEGR